jgi:hypothetical protein
MQERTLSTHAKEVRKYRGSDYESVGRGGVVGIDEILVDGYPFRSFE